MNGGAAERFAAAQREGRLMADRLARNALEIADTYERIACLHERVAQVDGHPLRGHAAAFAISERRLAALERAQAVQLARIAQSARLPEVTD